nr:proline-rich protein 36-like [Penaeus vannamei]
MTMDFPRKSSRGRGMLGPRPPQTHHAMANTLVSPRMDHSPSDSFMDGSPLGMGVSPLGGRPRSPMSPGDVAIKTEPPLSPTAKRPRPERVDWAPSPSTLSMESLSPPSFPSNGMGAMGGGQPSNAGSPLSSSSYEPSSPYPPRSGESAICCVCFPCSDPPLSSLAASIPYPPPGRSFIGPSGALPRFLPVMSPSTDLWVAVTDSLGLSDPFSASGERKREAKIEVSVGIKVTPEPDDPREECHRSPDGVASTSRDRLSRCRDTGLRAKVTLAGGMHPRVVWLNARWLLWLRFMRFMNSLVPEARH